VKSGFFPEPELEFGNGGTHVDIRYGIIRHGPLDLGDPTAPTSLRVGIVGTEETIAGLRAWLEKCRTGVAAKRSKLTNLFPHFPGFAADSCFRCSLVFHDRWCSSIRQRELEVAVAHTYGDEIVRAAAELFVAHAQSILEQGGPMVIICAPPKELLAAVDEPPSTRSDPSEQELDEGSDAPKDERRRLIPFHDVLKAGGLRLGVPIQMVRPYTYTGERTRTKTKGIQGSTATMQDEATRAWNLHAALYYKAGGVPWRLLRNPNDLATCFVGISFYKSLEGDRLLTSVAQVFNERGEGVIVKGAQAQLSKDDRQPHLTQEDAQALLKNAVAVYRKEHRTLPARLVVHKTSKLTEGELHGFRAASDGDKIDVLELLSLRRSFTRMFRTGTYPPLRGTILELQPSVGILYLRGSVQFFQAYPGMYAPRPLELTVASSEAPMLQLATEILSLSKLNWNNTQFDGGEPITVRAARRVGDILKCLAEGQPIQPSFRFYM